MISQHHFKKIPVVDEDNKVVGIISRGDALRTFIKAFLCKRIDENYVSKFFA